MGRDRVFIEENLLCLQLPQRGQSSPMKPSPRPSSPALAHLRPTEPSEKFQRLQQDMDGRILTKTMSKSTYKQLMLL